MSLYDDDRGPKDERGEVKPIPLVRPTRTTLAIGAVVLIVVGVAVVTRSRSSSSTTSTVVYAVNGSGPADLTFETPSGITQQTGVRLPWTDTEQFAGRAFVSISAQNMDGAGGDARCSITVSGAQIAHNIATGAAAIAECSGET